MFYPATAIFRTASGPLPAYALAPVAEEGEHELARPIMLMSGDSIYGVTRVRVHHYVNFVILQCIRNWCAMQEGHFRDSVLACVHLNHPLRMEAVFERTPKKQVMHWATLAAFHAQEYTLFGANGFVERRGIYEFMTKPYTTFEYGLGSRFCIDSQNMSENDFSLFLYSFLCVSFRLGYFLPSRKNKAVITLRMKNCFWRDFIVFLLISEGLKAKIEVKSINTYVYITKNEFAYFIRTLFEKIPDIPYRDFRMINKTLSEYVVVLDKNSVATLQVVDNPLSKSVEVTEYRPIVATCPGIEFPEITNFVEHNGMSIRLRSTL